MDDRDVYFLNFFHSVVRDDLDNDLMSDHKEFLKRVLANQGDCERLCATSSAMRCAYIYYYAPCQASSLYVHFTQLLEVNTFLLRRIILRQNFTVCCLCSGLSVDFLALTSLLESVLRECCPNMDQSTRRTNVDFVVVAVEPGWTNTVEKMAKKLLEDLGGMSSVNLNLQVLVADSMISLTDEVKEVLSQSDLVTIVHFVNSAPATERSSRLKIIQDVVKFIPGGGILFFLDTPSGGIYEAMEENLESSDEPLVEIYGPLRYYVHRMRLLCRKECIRLYSKRYGWRCCALENTCYVHAWYKRISKCV